MCSARVIAVLLTLGFWVHGAGRAGAQAIVPVATKPTPSAKPAATAPANQTSDERILHAAKLEATPGALLDFFRQRTRTEVDPAQLTAIIRGLTDPAP